MEGYLTNLVQISWLSVTGWRAEYGSWFYSLLCRVEKPLHPDLGSILRYILSHSSFSLSLIVLLPWFYSLLCQVEQEQETSSGIFSVCLSLSCDIYSVVD